MEKLKKQKTVWFWVALLTSVFAGISIPVIVLSAVNKMFLLMGISIALLVHGFYGCVFYWIAFSKRSTMIRLIKLITNENMLTVSMLSMQTGKAKGELISILRECIVKGYISGYYFDDAQLCLCKIMPVTEAIECSSCGASVTVVDGVGKCEYCGTNVNN